MCIDVLVHSTGSRDVTLDRGELQSCDVTKLICLCLFAVDGGYGPWGEFGECSVTCGGGVHQRERPCNSPEPKYSGKSCEEQELGTSIETESCSSDPCPGDFKLK